MSNEDQRLAPDVEGSGSCTSEHRADEGMVSQTGRTPTSRRTFIKGVIASGAAVSASAYMFRGPGISSAHAQGAAGTVERLMTLNDNGQERRVEVLPQETLVQTIRNKLGLTGTKIGCDHSECGNCTIHLDGKAIYSCSTLTHSCRGKKIVTIEGIESPDGKLHKVQQAMVDELAPQCGFCTPGQVMTAVAFLSKNPKPTVDQTRIAMSGNLCRCGAYDHYLKAVMRAAREA